MDIRTRARNQADMCLMPDLPLFACDGNVTLLDLAAIAPTFGRCAHVVLKLDGAPIAMGKQSRKEEEA
jgi:hypothetical protein